MQNINLIIALFQIQLQLLLPPNHGPAQPPADRGNLNATTATVSTNWTYAMEPMTVGTTQMNGFVVCIDCAVVRACWPFSLMQRQ